ncbi:hypothetical protein I5M27_01945 [Adhaeribacter sp. BT258]|uniref:Glycosyltransferase RgtA/B/C/D-like domain-containing protein n=1 Tax=Adhaeribacter terrigena TaxID=2793070 RepID=A0ABS1BX53_9BACT|nr:hypothetical protein [Adhaeribacter terrigena]MBK0401727.1 hypothetical protein [Adhaeribacter terrigena]
MGNQFIFLKDYLLLPFYLIGAILLMNLYFKVKHGKNSTLKKYFNWALYLKLFGCISISLIYQYYYGGSYDGINYFRGGKMLTSYWLEFPDQIIPVLFQELNTFNETNKLGLFGGNVHIFANESFTVSKIAAVFNFFTFDTFLPCAIFFCVIAFIGVWNFFIFIIKEFNIPIKIAAFSSILIPSVLIWDSGIFKDTITFTALMWLFICSYYIFIKPKNLIRNIIGILIAMLMIASIKLYILAAFIPFFIIYIINSNRDKIKNPAIKWFSTPFIFMFGAAAIALFLQNADELLGRYSVDQVLETAAQTAVYIQESSAGSAYSFEVDFSSPLGVLIAIPQGINISLFRPYPWEYLSPFIFFASAESMLFLYFTLYLLFKKGFGRSMSIIWNSPLIQFCLLFSFTFAFMVGVSSANFGSLVRYKIPFMPFYLLFLGILYKEKFVVSKIKTKKSKLLLTINNRAVISKPVTTRNSIQ